MVCYVVMFVPMTAIYGLLTNIGCVMMCCSGSCVVGWVRKGVMTNIGCVMMCCSGSCVVGWVRKGVMTGSCEFDGGV